MSEELIESKATKLYPELKKGDNSKYLAHSLTMWDSGKADLYNEQEVHDRIGNYFQQCVIDDMKPTVAGLGLCLGYDRRRIPEIVNDNGYMKGKSSVEVRDTIKKAYLIINAQMELYMQNGKINPVAGIFLMKNNMGYTDKQEVELSPKMPMGDYVDVNELQRRIEGTIIVDDDDY